MPGVTLGPDNDPRPSVVPCLHSALESHRPCARNRHTISLQFIRHSYAILPHQLPELGGIRTPDGMCHATTTPSRTQEHDARAAPAPGRHCALQIS